jgi:hypothetical protein
MQRDGGKQNSWNKGMVYGTRLANKADNSTTHTEDNFVDHANDILFDFNLL